MDNVKVPWVFYKKKPLETISANVNGLINILENYKFSKTLKSMIFMSSSEIYGDPDRKNIPTKESYKGNVSCVGPRACYDESKRLGETISTIFYNKFKSVISQVPTEQQVVPAEIDEQTDNEDKVIDNNFIEFEPNEKEILEELLPLNFAVQIFKALLESSASEQGSRMSAMDNASRNASDMIDSLTLFYNRSRQAVITKELIEIISGAEAV